MSIRAKITISLAIVLVLHISTAVMGHIGLQMARERMQVAEQVNLDTMRALEIDRTVNEIQGTVSHYMNSGHESTATRIRDLVEHARTQIASSEIRSENFNAQAWLESMGDRMGQYAASFEKVVVDRAARNELVKHRMPVLSDQIIGRLQDIRESDQDSNASALEAIDYMLLAEVQTMRYFEEPDRTHIVEGMERLAELRNAANRLRDPVLNELVNEYESDFLEAVQSTRGFLHLVNVVLAGQATELLHESSQFRRELIEHREQTLGQMQSNSTKFKVTSDVIASFTVIAGILTGFLMTRSVLRPINNITETLSHLANGETTGKIANATRRDEIGQMAAAAEVFRLQNIETEHLLEESQRLGRDLEQRNSEMTQFVYTVSHDLKSPLVTINGFANILYDMSLGEKHDEMIDVVGRIRRAANRMSTTIEDLLELSKIGVVVNEKIEVDTESLCREIASDMRSEILQVNAQIKFAEPLESIVGEHVRVRQVVQNLLQNALKYGCKENPDPIIEIASRIEDDFVVLSVTDNGGGIPEKYLDKIFGIFQRLDLTVPGSGVGLSIVKKIAEAHGGRVWVESTPGQGTSFYVSFPRSVSTASEAA